MRRKIYSSQPYIVATQEGRPEYNYKVGRYFEAGHENRFAECITIAKKISFFYS